MKLVGNTSGDRPVYQCEFCEVRSTYIKYLETHEKKCFHKDEGKRI